jgi:hypothetical protein
MRLIAGPTFTGEIAMASKRDPRYLAWALVIVAGFGLAMLFAPPVAGLPDYQMLFANDKLGGGRFGDALVPSLSRKTPVAERERVARGIAQKERLTELAIYSTEGAYKANVSASFLKEHPDALRQGFLGSLNESTFQPGEATFP